MKILHVVWGFTNGGIETMLVNIVNQQINIGYDVSIMVVNNLVTDSLKKLINPKVDFISINRHPKSLNLYYIYKYHKCYWKSYADIVHFHDITLSKIFYIKRKRDRWICTIHTNKLVEKVQSFVDNRISYYLAISKTVQLEILKFINSERVKLCYNAISIDRISFNRGIRPVIKNFVCISRMIFSLKGQDIIIYAFKLLKDLGYTDIHIDIYGDGCDFNEAKHLIEILGIEDMITLKGDYPYSDIVTNILNYDAIIQPSRYEGFGLTILEGLASNVLVVGSNVGGIEEMASLGAPIVLFKQNDIQDLVNKIVEIISQPEIYANMALAGRDFVEKNFSTSRQVRELSDIMNSIL